MKHVFTKDNISTIAALVLQQASLVGADKASIVALSGDLGAGKTTLTQEVGQALGVHENIISPTFVIMKTYAIRNPKHEWKNLVHIDAYRLDSSDELVKLGWQDIVANKDNLVMLEWPERVPECLNEDICRVGLAHVDEERREVSIVI